MDVNPADALLELITSDLLGAGCAGVGVASADPFLDVQADIEQRKVDGHHAGMHFTFADPVRSTDVERSFPWARSIVVASWAYVPDGGVARPRPNHGGVARFATEDHYLSLGGVLGQLADRLVVQGHKAEVVMDDNRLVDRAAAVRAGVGWWGKNTMVLAPKFGPWILLGSVVTSARIALTSPMRRDCGTCSACIPACPTGALIEPGVLDARKCLAYLLQSPGVIPAEFRDAIGSRIYGCDDCLDACPPGLKLAALPTRDVAVDLLRLLTLSDDELLNTFDHFYVPRRQARYLRRNVAVALGNVGNLSAVAALSRLLGDADDLLRVHAAWALGKIGGQEGVAALASAEESETVDQVRLEIRQAQAMIAAS